MILPQNDTSLWREVLIVRYGERVRMDVDWDGVVSLSNSSRR